MAAVHAQADGALEVMGDDAGMFLVARLPPGIDDVEVVTKARHAGIRVNALSQCYLDPPARGGVQLDYANSAPDDVPAKIAALRSIIHSCGAKR
jgi:GntR family transcriptional regulator/MocR family aminotransferase